MLSISAGSSTADTALRTGKAPGMTPDFRLNLQRMYDPDVACATTGVSAIEAMFGFEAYRPTGRSFESLG